MMIVDGHQNAQPFANKVVGHFVQFAAVRHVAGVTGTDRFIDRVGEARLEGRIQIGVL